LTLSEFSDLIDPDSEKMLAAPTQPDPIIKKTKETLFIEKTMDLLNV